ncbi:hypothetical protein SDC9_141476 [bioreactor metagenome]|uniref:Uncharacterized protein n=1 Tax=bioreactor metagenome TaxID=1076179 RepID=A0A645DXT8_9ZZZZ
MQVGEQHHVGTQVLVFGRDRFLDLQEQVGCTPGFGGRPDESSAGVLVCLVADRRADTGSGLDQDFMAVLDQLVHAGRSYSDAGLLALDLLGTPIFMFNLPDWEVPRRCGTHAKRMMRKVGQRNRRALHREDPSR